jgi:hypothetical protein
MMFDSNALSIAGRRTNNEDAVCAQPGLGLFDLAAHPAGAAVEDVAVHCRGPRHAS